MSDLQRPRFGHAWRIRRLALRVLFLALAGVWLAWLNIFNVDEASQDVSAKYFLRLFGDFPEANRRLPDEPVVVVLYDADQLDVIARELNEHWTWPLTFKQQAVLLRTLKDLKPRAVFFDMAFYQERDGETDFADAISKTTETGLNGNPNCAPRDPGKRVPGIPVFLAEIPDRPIESRLCSAGAEGVDIRWDSRPLLYPMQTCDDAADFQPGARNYCEHKRDMAATRLWRDWCLEHANVPSCKLRGEASDEALLSLTWGTGTHPQQALFMGDQCPAKTSLSERLWTELLAALRLVPHDEVFYRCPQPLTIPAAWLVLKGDDNDEALLRRVIKDKLVLIGANFPGLRDTLPSPVHDNLPGVFTHAQALDNLIRYPGRTRLEARSDYFTAETEAFFSLKTLRTFVVIYVALFFILWRIHGKEIETHELAVLAYSHERLPRRERRKALRILRMLVGLMLGLFVYVLAIATFSFEWWRIAPVNWAEMAVLTIALAAPEIVTAARFAILELLFRSRVGRRIGQFFFHPPRHGETP
ncbi:MAG TPA: CHASE2 domain-containing protein [Rhizomicrobium sp.]|nr:CHASE2 domain-containing protein [Rhizomicrobium sp.]